MKQVIFLVTYFSYTNGTVMIEAEYDNYQEAEGHALNSNSTNDLEIKKIFR